MQSSFSQLSADSINTPQDHQWATLKCVKGFRNPQYIPTGSIRKMSRKKMRRNRDKSFAIKGESLPFKRLLNLAHSLFRLYQN